MSKKNQEKSKYLKAVHFITHNSIAATVIMLFALTAVGASAAELFAPAEYKPSSFFKPASEITNFQECREASGILIGNNPRECRIDGKSFTEELEEEIVVTNFEECVEQTGIVMESYPEQCVFEGKTFTREIEEETQPLLADENHDVVVIEGCDLAIRFAKSITAEDQSFNRQVNYFEGVLSLTNLNDNVMDEPSGMDITCNQEVMNEDMYDLQDEKDKDEFCDTLNLTQATCDKVEDFQEYLMTENYTPNRNILFKFTIDENQYRVLLGCLDQSQTQGLENIQIQQNSLAPSQSSVDLQDSQDFKDDSTTSESSAALNLKNTPSTNQKTYTNHNFPDLRIVYNNSWKLNTQLTYQPLSSDFITLEKSGTKISLAFLRGIGGMNQYQCHSDSNKYSRVGGFVKTRNSANTYEYLNGSFFAFQGENNFQNVKQQVAQKIPELGRDMNGNYITPLPTNQDTVCINGDSGHLIIKSKHPVDKGPDVAAIQLTIQGQNQELIKEAEQILKNSVIR